MIKVLRVNAPACILVLFAVEFAILAASFYVGLALSWVQFDFTLAQFLTYLPRSMLFVGVTMLSMFAFGLYRRDGIVNASVMIPRLAGAFASSLLVLSLLFYSIPLLVIWRSVLGTAMPLALVLVFASRHFAKDAFDSRILKRRVAVLGAGRQAARIEQLDRAPHAGFTCVGYVPVDDEPILVPRHRLLPPTNDIPALLKGDRVEELVIATDRRDELPTRALVDCRLGGIRIGDYETFHGHETGRIDLDYLSPEWFFVEDGFHAGFIDRWSKRTLDVLLSIVLLIATLPLSLLVSLAIWLEDGGNVLYRQTRVGRGGKVFHLVKFRSMRWDAEADGIPRWTANGDDRVTSVGRALRVTHLDELPQLWNILKGEMSIVGPRPERPYFVERLAATHPYFLDRHAVKPGIAGWAQINCPYTRSEYEARRKLEYDLYYVKYGSVLMDFVILLQTVRVVFWPSSAR